MANNLPPWLQGAEPLSPSPTASPKKPLRQRLFIGFSAIIGTCLLCFTLMLLNVARDGQGDDTATVSEEAGATEEVDSTAAVVSTAAPELATGGTPVSTATPAPTPANDPVNTEALVPDEPGPESIQDTFISGGLGLHREVWEAKRGTGVSQFGMTDYSGGYSILFMEDRIWHLEQQWSSEISLAGAQSIAQQLIPPDSERLETYSPPDRPEAVVERYLSPSLAGQFGEEVWEGWQPGEFIVIYKVFNGHVPRLIIGVGNNP